ncbi:MAG: hypothetical protein F9K14_07395 [Candidatus Methanoperedens sp.]|nr:MAG: hypothetical protein F9K14_07395 [Candidatus Methanoperedens sp.]
MVEDYRKSLKNLLRKLFQFDSEDLDYCIYRIMNRMQRTWDINRSFKCARTIMETSAHVLLRQFTIINYEIQMNI